jgi:hypothetical protein
MGQLMSDNVCSEGLRCWRFQEVVQIRDVQNDMSTRYSPVRHFDDASRGDALSFQPVRWRHGAPRFGVPEMVPNVVQIGGQGDPVKGSQIPVVEAVHSLGVHCDQEFLSPSVISQRPCPANGTGSTAIGSERQKYLVDGVNTETA